MSKKDKLSLEYYATTIANMIKPGITYKEHDFLDGEIGIGYDNVESRDCIKKYYFVVTFQDTATLAYFSTLRDRIKVEFNKKVRLNIQTDLVPHHIDFDSRRMKERRRLWINSVDSKLEKSRDKTAAEKSFTTSTEVIDDKNVEWLMDSWNYWLKMVDDGRQLFKTKIILELSVSKSNKNYKELLYKASEFLKKYSSRQIVIKEVRNFNLDFLREASPVSSGETKYASKVIRSRVLTDVILTRLFKIPQGEINPKDGIPIGYDQKTNQMVYKNFARDTQGAENCLISGKSGSGKSFFVKHLIMNFLSYMYDVIMIDYEGHEYKPLVEFLGGQRVSIGTAEGGYPDTLELPEPTGDIETDSDSYERSVTSTLAILSCVCDIENGLSSSELRIINEAINNIHREVGVVPLDVSTWHNSQKLSYHMLYNEIKNMEDNNQYGMELKNLRDKLFIYFDEKGLNYTTFSRKMSIRDILPKKDSYGNLIVFSFNMKGKSAEGIELQKLTIKQITCSYLVAAISIHNRNLGKFTFVGFEEFQRYCKNKGAYKAASELFTGARKLNVISAIITNEPEQIVSTDNGFAMDVAGNIQNFFLGKLEEKTIDGIASAWGLSDCVEMLNLMRYESSTYNNMFLAKLDEGVINLIKACVPQELAKTDIFKTRDERVGV